MLIKQVFTKKEENAKRINETGGNSPDGAAAAVAACTTCAAA